MGGVAVGVIGVGGSVAARIGFSEQIAVAVVGIGCPVAQI